MNKFTLTFQHERETKGAHLFKEVKADGSPCATPMDGSIGSLYIRKTAMQNGSTPKVITVTVESV